LRWQAKAGGRVYSWATTARASVTAGNEELILSGATVLLWKRATLSIRRWTMTELKRYLMDEVVIDMLENVLRLREDVSSLYAAESEESYWQIHWKLELDLRWFSEEYYALRKGDSHASRQLGWLLEPQVEWVEAMRYTLEREVLHTIRDGGESVTSRGS
jgi:hypothetical protein